MTQSNNNEQTKRQLPAFTQTIQIEVEVNEIYQNLLHVLPEDYQHRERLAHAIIGSMPKEKLLYAYNAMNGLTNEVDFQIGDKVICTQSSRVEWYDSTLEDTYGVKKPVDAITVDQVVAAHKPMWKSRRVEIGECEVVEIDMYSSEKLKVKFMGASAYDSSDRKEISRDERVNHRRCTKVADPVFVPYEERVK